MKRSSFAAGALLIAFIASSTGWAAPAKSSRPKLSSFKLVVVAPRAEIQDSKGKVLATIQQGYVVWPTLYGKGHYKVKCQDKKAKGGWIDGWIKAADVLLVPRGQACYVVPEGITVIEEPKIITRLRAKAILQPGNKSTNDKKGFAHIYYKDRNGQRKEGWVPLQSVLKVSGN